MARPRTGKANTTDTEHEDSFPPHIHRQTRGDRDGTGHRARGTAARHGKTRKLDLGVLQFINGNELEERRGREEEETLGQAEPAGA